MVKLIKKVKTNVWYRCMPQLVSRVGHRNQETIQVITQILVNVLVDYPKQGYFMHHKQKY